MHIFQTFRAFGLLEIECLGLYANLLKC